MINRRDFLKGAAAGAVLVSGRGAFAAEPARRLTIETRQIEVLGRSAKAFALLGPDGKEGLEYTTGEMFDVRLENNAGVESLIHWHGLTPPWQQDGVPGVSQPALPAGKSYDYSFPLKTPGTYWMHSHQGLQEQQMASAPLIIHDPKEAALDQQEVVVLLHDFSFRQPEEILADLIKAAGGSGGGMAAMGMNAVGTPGMGAMGSGQMGSGQMGSGAKTMDLNDVDYDAFLANGRTLEDPEVFPVEKGAKVRLRLINGGATTNYTIDLGALDGTLIAVDGHRVKQVKGRHFPIAVAQRLDILVQLPSEGGAFPVLALQEGTTARSGFLLASAGAPIQKLASQGTVKGPPLNLLLEASLRPTAGLPKRKIDRRFVLKLEGTMKGYGWNFDGVPYPRHAPLMLKQGERVELSYRNTTMMSHPIHLHGHSYQVVGIGGRQRFQGAVRDTVLVPPMQTVDVIFDADNPGKWVMHCHQLYHMAVGMFVELQYEGFT